MQTLRMLGSIGLTGSDGAEVDALLRQPKSVALLAYLAMPRPGTWHRRDVLLATFWPELSQSRARAALRSALHLLRCHLDGDTIRTRGDDEVALDADRLATDVAALLDDIEARAHERAVARYAGPLLRGLYISDAPEFERWLETQRVRLNDAAVRAAAALVDESEAAGDLTGATDAARRASELSPDDESAMRRWVVLLDRAGDRAGALAVFERFRARISQEFGSDPSTATLALIDELRARAVRGDRGTPAAPVFVRDDAAAAAPPDARGATPPHPVHTAAARPVRPARRSLFALAAAGGALFLAGYAALHRTGTATGTEAATRLLLLPVEIEPADSAQRYLATGLGMGIVRRLERLGGLAIRSGSGSEWPAAPGTEPSGIDTLGAALMLRITLARIGDSLDVRAALADSASRTVRDALAQRFAITGLAEIESEVAAAVAGRIHRVSTPFDPRPARHVVEPESYRLTILGFHQLLVMRDTPGALASFVRATELDPLNVRAWAGVSSVWASRSAGDQVPLEEGYQRSSSAAERALAIDSTDGTALANLGFMRAMERRNLSAGMPLLRRAMHYEPSNAEIYLVASFLDRYSHRWDEARDLIRVARELDPLTPRYAENEGGLEMCVGRPAASEQVFRRLLEQRPASVVARDGLVRALAAQRRFDEALDAWRAGVAPSTSPDVVTALRGAHGRDGYFAARHAQGRVQLDALRRATEGKRTPPLALIFSLFQAGDTAAGFARLAAAAHDREPWIYRLQCFAELEEVRDTPRYRKMLAEIGAMPAR